jgi:hypothetical protein
VRERARSVALTSTNGIDPKFSANPVQVVDARDLEGRDGNWATRIAVAVELMMHGRTGIECASPPLLGLPASSAGLVARELAALQYAKPGIELLVVLRVNANELHVSSR